MSTKRSGESVFHASIIVHLIRDVGSHEKFDGKKLGLFSEPVFRWMKAEEALPFTNVVGIVVGLDASTCDPDGMTIGHFGVRKSVTIGCHDPSNGTTNILIGGIGVLSET